MSLPAKLHKVAEDLDALARAADDAHPIDPFEVLVAAARVRAQAEMIEKELIDV